jgi:hypothetical protein
MPRGRAELPKKAPTNWNAMSADPGARAAVLPLPRVAMRKSIRVEPDGRASHDPIAAWDALPDAVQVKLAAAAMRRAATTLASQAETLAQEMESGALSDCGGPEALRLLAVLVRIANEREPADAATR